MSREQIEEMAKIIHDSVDVDNPCPDEKYGGFSCFGCDYLDEGYCQHDIERAIGLYNAGYRKADEFAREIFEEIEKLHLHITNEFDLRRYNELKKKYTEG